MYPAELVKPMREELTSVGFNELTTSEDVSNAMSKEGTTLVVVNSICGCAAANARPGLTSLSKMKKHLIIWLLYLQVWTMKLLKVQEI